ncbi:MAG: hypothetical protein ACK5Q5_16770 [Planctomycetaceae bacterium]
MFFWLVDRPTCLPVGHRADSLTTAQFAHLPEVGLIKKCTAAKIPDSASRDASAPGPVNDVTIGSADYASRLAKTGFFVPANLFMPAKGSAFCASSDRLL